MPIHHPDAAVLTPKQAAALRTRKLALLRAEGLQPNTPDSVVEEALKILDPADLHTTLNTIKSRWPHYFGTPRSADRIADRALGASSS